MATSRDETADNETAAEENTPENMEVDGKPANAMHAKEVILSATSTRAVSQRGLARRRKSSVVSLKALARDVFDLEHAINMDPLYEITSKEKALLWKHRRHCRTNSRIPT